VTVADRFSFTQIEKLSHRVATEVTQQVSSVVVSLDLAPDSLLLTIRGPLGRNLRRGSAEPQALYGIKEEAVGKPG
jgi:hypothetical protein